MQQLFVGGASAFVIWSELWLQEAALTRTAAVMKATKLLKFAQSDKVKLRISLNFIENIQQQMT